MYIYKSESPQATVDLAKKLGKLLRGGELIALEGDLGAGKTLFVKGLACGLEVLEPVTSPTFTLMHIYQGRLPLVHFDVYRLPAPEAIEELGYDEYFYGSRITAVEWSDLIEAYLPNEYLKVVIRREYDQDRGEYRLISMIPYGKRFTEIVEELSKNVGTGD